MTDPVEDKEQEVNDDDMPNIIELLLERDLTRLCYQIYNKLDSQSLTNCRLVCHNWKDFVEHQFYELPKGRLHVKNLLKSNFFNESFHPRTKTVW